MKIYVQNRILIDIIIGFYKSNCFIEYVSREIDEKITKNCKSINIRKE